MNIEIRSHLIQIQNQTNYVSYSEQAEQQATEEYHKLANLYLKYSLIKEHELEPLEPQLEAWRAKDNYDSIWITTINKSFVVSDETLLELTIDGVNFTYGNAVTTKANVSKQLADLANKPIELLTGSSGNTYNNKCEVHMPGQALSMYNDVMLLEDTCTDVLQTHLANGWRIIAACPQPTQRRPDYILGRYNPQLDYNESAKRN